MIASEYFVRNALFIMKTRLFEATSLLQYCQYNVGHQTVKANLAPAQSFGIQEMKLNIYLELSIQNATFPTEKLPKTDREPLLEISIRNADCWKCFQQ